MRTGYRFRQITLTAVAALLLSACQTTKERGLVESSKYPPNAYRIASGFGDRYLPNLPGTRAQAGLPPIHKGVDITAPVGTAVVSAAYGKVYSVGVNKYCGKRVSVEVTRSREARWVSYHHLGSVDVKEGEYVAVGQKLGSIGSCRPPHLHFSVSAANGIVDPAPFLFGTNGSLACLDPAKEYGRGWYYESLETSGPELLYPVVCTK